MANTSKRDKAQAKVNAAVETLNTGVENLTTSDQWTQMLTTAARFHRYSFGNTMLIMLQAPTATAVAGYRRWQDLGRQVRKGETSISILAPRFGKCRDCQGEGGDCHRCSGTGRYRYYATAGVFDVAQTDPIDGHPNPYDPATHDVLPELLTGLEGDDVYRLAADVLTADGWKVEQVHDSADRMLAGGANGYCDHEARRIVVSADRAPAQQVKTLVHEWGHALLHGAGVDYAGERGRCEVEAESVAFVVLTALGVTDTSGYSFPYVARWAKGNVDVVKAAGQAVVVAAQTIVEALEAAVQPAADLVAA